MRSSWRPLVLAAVLLLGAGFLVSALARAGSGKYAIILQAGRDSHEGMARALHAFLYAKELREHGHAVVLIFDGAGTTWASELSDPDSDSKLKGLYEAFLGEGGIEIVCDYCAAAFQVREPLVERGRSLDGAYAGHPSIAKWADEGYALLVL